jgi:uncharacterized DUF497 family protein
MTFEWDGPKERVNIQKHGVDFNEASSCFADPLKIEVYDEVHSIIEDRFILFGISFKGRLLAVCYVERGYDRTRIITARVATKKERDFYNQSNRP